MGNKKLFGWLDFGGDILGSVANVISTALTNKSNQRIADARNAMQIAENEKAYQRSKPTNQVANLQAAGMSKAGALNTLNGGGSYTPATISSSTNQAPQVDLSSAFDGLITIGENAKQRKLQEDLLDKQIKAAKEQQEAQFAENAEQREHEQSLQWQRSQDTTQGQYLDYTKHSENLEFNRENARKNWRLIDRQIAQLEKQTEYIGVQIKGQELDNIRKRLENDNYPTLAKLMNDKALKEVEKLIVDINQAEKQGNLDAQRKRIENRFLLLTEKYRIDAENARNELSAFMDDWHLGTNEQVPIFASFELLFNDYWPKFVK